MKQRQYLASEDSALLREALAGYSGDRFLEIGSGNAGALGAVASRFQVIAGTDVVRPDSSSQGTGNATLVLADRATCFRDHSFDLVAFNPPYLPSEAIEDRAVDGGRGGAEVPFGFMEEALRVVKKGGVVLMLLSSETEPRAIKALCERRGFEMKVVARRRLFYEELAVHEARAV